MSSILTNNSAMSALAALTATQKSLDQTQNQISTGLRVSDASDNAAYWAISTKMKSDTGALSSVSDALNLGSSTVGVASAAVDSTISIMNKMKADLVSAQTPGTDRSNIQADISALQQSLMSITGSASFNGVNLVNGTATNTSVVASFSRATNGTTQVGSITIGTSSVITGSTTSGILSKAMSAVTLSGATTASSLSSSSFSTAGNGTNSVDNTTYASSSILAFSISNSTTTNDLAVIAANIDLAITALTTAGETLGSAKTNISNQATFVSALSDAITSGVGSLVDADMNVASTRLQALQTQQQLGIQSLSIANQNSQMILKLFQ